MYVEDHNDAAGDEHDDNEGNVVGDVENVDDDDENTFCERQPNKDLSGKTSRKTESTSAPASTSDAVADKMPISIEQVDMDELHNPAGTYDVITFEDVKDESTDEAKPKSRQSYAKKARLSIIGKFARKSERNSIIILLFMCRFIILMKRKIRIAREEI